MKARGSRSTDDVPSDQGFLSWILTLSSSRILRRSLASSEAWAQDVFAQGEPALLVVGGDLGGSVKIEPLGLRTQRALADGAVVGVEHDAQGLALVGRACGCCAGGGCRQEPRQERVFLAHGFVTDDGHLAVAWGGHQGDDFAALEKTQDALAGSSHERLDLVLRGRGRRMEHQTLAIAVGRVDTVETDGVNMWIESQIAVGALDDGHGAGRCGRKGGQSLAPKSHTT